MVGIYKIISPNNKIYIGQSVNIEKRWIHYRLLDCKKQPKIYRSILKYGFKNHIFEKLKEDERVSYLIFNKKIWSRQLASSGNRPYSGSNPHTKHLHVSIHPHMADDTSPWFWWMNQPKIVNQVKAALQPAPKKKTTVQPVCTCCLVHNTKRKAK